MEQYILFDKTNKEFFWCDDPYLLKDNSFIHITTAKENDYIEIHECKMSVLWDNYEPTFKDTVQNEESLPDDIKYIVNYYKATEDKSLLKETDIGITKTEIIENIKNQKYREGAFYYQANLLLQTNPEYMYKNYQWELPDMLHIPSTICPEHIKAKTPDEARKQVLRILGNYFQKTGIQLELNGISVFTEIGPDKRERNFEFDEYQTILG